MSQAQNPHETKLYKKILACTFPFSVTYTCRQTLQTLYSIIIALDQDILLAKFMPSQK